MRVAFNGVIEGSVTVRAGETEAAAIARAERDINDAMLRHCRSFRRADDTGFGVRGPIVGLEPAE